MAKSSSPRRLSPTRPLVREYVIASTFVSDNSPDVTVCKYLTVRKNGDNWEEFVKSEWVDNPDHFDLAGRFIRVTTEIV